MTRVLSLAVFLWAVLSVQGQSAFACGMHADSNSGESRNLRHSNTEKSSFSPHYWLLKSRAQDQTTDTPCHKSCCAKMLAPSCNHCPSASVISQDTRTLPAMPEPALSVDPFSDDLSPIVTTADPFAHKYRLPVYLATSRLRF